MLRFSWLYLFHVIINGYVDAATLLSGAVAASRLQYKTEFSSRKKFSLSEVETDPCTALRYPLMISPMNLSFPDQSLGLIL
jgi:hypothetical protein